MGSLDFSSQFVPFPREIVPFVHAHKSSIIVLSKSGTILRVCRLPAEVGFADGEERELEQVVRVRRQVPDRS